MDGLSGSWTKSRVNFLGATFVGRDTIDLLHASTVAIVRVDIGRLWHAVPSFPTMSEVYGNLLNACGL